MSSGAPVPTLCPTDREAASLPSPSRKSKTFEATKGTRPVEVCETDSTVRRIDRQSMDYVVRSGLAGGIAGCAAKTLIAPLDRVKILFQTSNPQFARYSGQWLGVWYASKDLHQQFGITGLFKGHSATLLRIFPYAAIKFVAYEQFRAVLIPNPEDEVPWRRFTAGSLAGVTSVFFTYPLEVIRVRLAFETKSRRLSIREICREMFNEVPREQASASAALQPSSQSRQALTSTVRQKSTLAGLANFYRGFGPTLAGMLPYAGMSFLSHDWITDLLRDERIARYTMLYPGSETDTRHSRPPLYVWAELTAGGLAGMLAQTASYPLEVVRRRMQVSGAVGTGQKTTFMQTSREIIARAGFKGFYVGLTIGYIKVVPMVACSFYVYERMKLSLNIN